MFQTKVHQSVNLQHIFASETYVQRRMLRPDSDVALGGTWVDANQRHNTAGDELMQRACYA